MNFSEIFSSPVAILAQCVGFVAMILALFIYSFRDRKRILFSKLTADVLWAIHYTLLSQYTAAAINLVSIGRESVFYNRSIHKWASIPFWPVLFICLNIATTFLTGGDFTPVSFLPVIGSSLAVIGLWCKNTLLLRLFNLPGVTLWLIYAVIIGSLSSIICNILSVTSITFGLIRDIRDRIKLAKSKEN